MPLTRTQKEEVVTAMSDSIKDATSVVFASYDGLTVSDASDLRDKLHEAGCSMRVVPKRLLKLVMTSTKLEFDPAAQEGQLAVVWGDDEVSPAKVLYEFTKEHDSVALLSGVLEDSMISLEQVMSLAQLPSYEEMLARFVGVLAGPMRTFAGVLSGVPRQMVYVLQDITGHIEKPAS